MHVEITAAVSNLDCEISGLQCALEGVRTVRGRTPVGPTRVGPGAVGPATRVSVRAVSGLGWSRCQNSSEVSNPP